MNFRHFIHSLVLIVVLMFLHVHFTKLPGTPRQLQDAFIYRQLITNFSQLDSSELTAAPGVHTVSFFPKNTPTISTGENYVLLVGAKNKEELPIQIIGLRAYLCRPNDCQRVVQAFKNHLCSWIVPPTYTATWEYMFSVSQYVKGGVYKVVSSLIYSTPEDRYHKTYYNGTVIIVEAPDPIRVTDAIVSVVFLLAVFYGIWVYAYPVISNALVRN